MAATQALASAAEFARDAVHEAAIDRAALAGRSAYGSEFYVLIVADLGNAETARAIADTFELAKADDPAAAYVGAVSSSAFEDEGIALTQEDGSDGAALEFPDDNTDAVLVVCMKDDTVLVIEHTTRAAMGRTERSELADYIASVAAREVEAAEDATDEPFSGTTKYGADVSTFVVNPDGELDLDPRFTIISGPRVVAEAVARRLVTSRGTLKYDGDFGLDIRDWINSDIASAESSITEDPVLFALRSSIEGEAEKDERVESAAADVTYSRTDKTVTATVRITPVTGAVFKFVLAIDAVTAQILKVTT